MPLRPARSESFQVKAKDAALLRQLARGFHATPDAVLSHLIREAYAANVKQLEARAGFGFDLSAAGAKKPAAKKKKAKARKPSGRNTVVTVPIQLPDEPERPARPPARPRAKR